MAKNGQSTWRVSFEIAAPADATYEQVEALARYHVQENGSLRAPMADWKWEPIPFSVYVSER